MNIDESVIQQFHEMKKPPPPEQRRVSKKKNFCFYHVECLRQFLSFSGILIITLLSSLLLSLIIMSQKFLMTFLFLKMPYFLHEITKLNNTSLYSSFHGQMNLSG